MHHFKYRDNVLCCEDVSIQEISAKIGTPFYLYSYATLKRHFQVFDAAFDGVPKLICFSAKANTNLAVLKIFADMGCGLDIVSGGELFRGSRPVFLRTASFIQVWESVSMKSTMPLKPVS